MTGSTRALGLVAILLALPAAARAEQRVGFSFGYFTVVGEDSRADDDALIVNRLDALPLAFEVDDFNNVTVGGEWLVSVNPYLEMGAGFGYYSRTVPSVYEDFVDDDGTELQQDLRLRIVPFMTTARLLPLGSDSPIQPYIGGGLGVFMWRYSEIGEFVDPSDLTIFSARYIADGTEVGLVVLGGVRFDAGDRASIGGEMRYQRARGTLDDDFLGDTIDLGGFTYQAVFHLRF